MKTRPWRPRSSQVTAGRVDRPRGAARRRRDVGRELLVDGHVRGVQAPEQPVRGDAGDREVGDHGHDQAADDGARRGRGGSRPRPAAHDAAGCPQARAPPPGRRRPARRRSGTSRPRSRRRSPSMPISLRSALSQRTYAVTITTVPTEPRGRAPATPAAVRLPSAGRRTAAPTIRAGPRARSRAGCRPRRRRPGKPRREGGATASATPRRGARRRRRRRRVPGGDAGDRRPGGLDGEPRAHRRDAGDVSGRGRRTSSTT